MNQTVDEHRRRILQLDCWPTGTNLTIEALAGGITNPNYHVIFDKPLLWPGSEDSVGSVVVRLGGDIPVHQILRRSELAASLAASRCGLSPKVRYHEPGVLVIDHIEARTLTEADIRDDTTLARLLPVLKRCHSEIPLYLRGNAPLFWVFHVIRDYAATLQEANSAWCDRLPDLLTRARQLESAAGPFDISFCHNDLLAANLLDDGNRLWLIDWEYAGFNTPLFDLGGLASNNQLTEHQQRWLLENYFERTLDESTWIRYQALKTASLLRESLWSMVSEEHSTLTFDYAAYSRENLTRFEASLAIFEDLTT